MVDNHFAFLISTSSAAPQGAAAAMGEEISALQTLIDILSRTHDVGCEPCGGTGIKGRGLCPRCHGRGSLQAPLTPAFSRC